MKQQLWPGVEKGKCCLHKAKKRFTISPWLPRQTYITVNIWKQKKVQENKKKREGTIEEREKKETRWCHGFHSKRTRSSQQGKRTNTKLFFPLLSHSFGLMWRLWKAATKQPSSFSRCGNLALFGIPGKGGRKERGRRRPKFHIRFLSKTDLESAAGFKAQRERRITISGGYQGRHFEAWSLCNTDRTHCYLRCSSSAQALWLKCVNVKKVQNLPCKLMSVPM